MTEASLLHVMDGSTVAMADTEKWREKILWYSLMLLFYPSTNQQAIKFGRKNQASRLGTSLR